MVKMHPKDIEAIKFNADASFKVGKYSSKKLALKEEKKIWQKLYY